MYESRKTRFVTGTIAAPATKRANAETHPRDWKLLKAVRTLRTLEPGHFITVEPGLYFQLDDLTVPARYRGIGVRIEDDVLVTAKGMRNLSRDIPSEASAVETWMAACRKKKA